MAINGKARGVKKGVTFCGLLLRAMLKEKHVCSVVLRLYLLFILHLINRQHNLREAILSFMF